MLYYSTSPAVSEVRAEDSTGCLVLEELQLKNVIILYYFTKPFTDPVTAHAHHATFYLLLNLWPFFHVYSVLLDFILFLMTARCAVYLLCNM